MDRLLGLDYVNPYQEIPNPSEARQFLVLGGVEVRFVGALAGRGRGVLGDALADNRELLM
jgi:hypothetical protein